MAKEDGGGTGLMASLRQESASAKNAKQTKSDTPVAKTADAKSASSTSKRTTPPKSKPTPNRPVPSNRPKPSGTSRHSKPTKP